MSLENISLDIDFVRSQFPAFKDPLCKDWAFFENAGGSYVPQTVINHLNKFMISTKVQPYAEYPMSKIAGDQMDKAVNLFSQMINAKKNEILITADTIVLKGGQILNKPKNKIQAKEMLVFLSGSSHKVITSVCLRDQQKKLVFSSITKVFFKSLSDAEINYYVEEYKPLDKAGSYGIQEWIGLIGITKIEGSYFNVVGLPIEKLYQKLIQFASL